MIYHLNHCNQLKTHHKDHYHTVSPLTAIIPNSPRSTPPHNASVWNSQTNTVNNFVCLRISGNYGSKRHSENVVNMPNHLPVAVFLICLRQVGASQSISSPFIHQPIRSLRNHHTHCLQSENWQSKKKFNLHQYKINILFTIFNYLLLLAFLHFCILKQLLLDILSQHELKRIYWRYKQSRYKN